MVGAGSCAGTSVAEVLFVMPGSMARGGHLDQMGSPDAYRASAAPGHEKAPGTKKPCRTVSEDVVRQGSRKPGNNLLSRIRTIIGGSCLTTVFGMRTGMANYLYSPGILVARRDRRAHVGRGELERNNT